MRVLTPKDKKKKKKKDDADDDKDDHETTSTAPSLYTKNQARSRHSSTRTDLPKTRSSIENDYFHRHQSSSLYEAGS